jgi:hypothetical protein
MLGALILLPALAYFLLPPALLKTPPPAAAAPPGRVAAGQRGQKEKIF